MRSLATVTSAALVVALAACENKVAECRSLSEVINAQQDKLDQLGSKSDAQSRSQLADGLDESARRLQAVPLKLEPLKKLRDEYRQTTTGIAKGIRTLADVQASENPDLAKVDAATGEVLRAEEQAKKLTAELNNYCQGKDQGK